MIEWVCQHRRFSRSQSSHRLFVNICLFNSSVNPIVPGGSALEKRPSDISSTNGKSSGQADEARTALYGMWFGLFADIRLCSFRAQFNPVLFAGDASSHRRLPALPPGLLHCDFCVKLPQAGAEQKEANGRSLPLPVALCSIQKSPKQGEKRTSFTCS